MASGYRVVACDYSRAMLENAKRCFSDPGLTYQLGDSRDLPFNDLAFDSVISVNSVLPERRLDVQRMFDQIHRVLKVGGRFVGFLPAYNSLQKASLELGLDVRLDQSSLRVWDTVGWQCYHTKKSLQDELGESGFVDIAVEVVEFSTQPEIDNIRRLYNVDTSSCLAFGYLVTACKLKHQS